MAAVIPVEHLELLLELLARQEAERRTAEIDWQRLADVSPPPQQWFEGDEPKPFGGHAGVCMAEPLQFGRIAWAEIADANGFSKSRPW